MNYYSGIGIVRQTALKQAKGDDDFNLSLVRAFKNQFSVACPNHRIRLGLVEYIDYNLRPKSGHFTFGLWIDRFVFPRRIHCFADVKVYLWFIGSIALMFTSLWLGDSQGVSIDGKHKTISIGGLMFTSSIALLFSLLVWRNLCRHKILVMVDGESIIVRVDLSGLNDECLPKIEPYLSGRSDIDCMAFFAFISDQNREPDKYCRKLIWLPCGSQESIYSISIHDLGCVSTCVNLINSAKSSFIGSIIWFITDLPE